MKRCLWVAVALIATVAPSYRARADILINANFVSSAPTLDGTVTPSEYGGGPTFAADFSNLNASNPSRLSAFVPPNSFITMSKADYSYDLYAAYTTTTLYLGFVVRDSLVSLASSTPYLNSDVELFIGGNRVGNNYQNFGAVASKQAFQILSDAAGNQFTSAGGAFANGDWAVAHSPVASQDYTLEFAIPLNLIDTHENGQFTPAHAGSLLRFNVGSVKNDAVIAAEQNYSVLDQVVPYGHDYPASHEYAPNGTLIWAADLRLVPVPEPASSTIVGTAALAWLGLLWARRRRAAID
jgi:MYXO-CTERM domain-containing protein